MSIRVTQLLTASFAIAFFVSTVDAQVLPRNKDRRANANPANANPANTTQQNVERNANVRTEAQRTNENAADQTRVRTQVDSNVSRTGQTNVNVLRSTQIVGTMVSVQGNQQVGKVTEIVFNDQGCIDYLIVDLNGRMAPIPWHVGSYDYRARVFVLDNFDQARIARIPTFTNYNQITEQTFVTQVNDFFGARANTGVNVRTDNVRGGASVRSTTEGSSRTTTQESNRTTQDPNRPDARSQRSTTPAKDQDDAAKSDQNDDQPAAKSRTKTDAGTQPRADDTSDSPKSDDQKDNQPKQPKTAEPREDAPSKDADANADAPKDTP